MSGDAIFEPRPVASMQTHAVNGALALGLAQAAKIPFQLASLVKPMTGVAIMLAATNAIGCGNMAMFIAQKSVKSTPTAIAGRLVAGASLQATSGPAKAPSTQATQTRT